MNRYEVYVTRTIDVVMTIEAETEENAISIAEEESRLTEYCNDTIGCEPYDDAVIECCINDNDYIENTYIEEL